MSVPLPVLPTMRQSPAKKGEKAQKERKIINPLHRDEEVKMEEFLLKEKNLIPAVQLICFDLYFAYWLEQPWQLIYTS